MLKVSQAILHPQQQTDSDHVFSHTFGGGEISVVLGANRSGKTDLCRLIAGFATQATGEVRLDDELLTGLDPRERPVAMVFQAFVNYPNLSVRDNIASPLRAQREDPQVIAQTVNTLAGQLRLDGLLDRLPAELSGGQQQRLAIARAMAKQARVLLLDEPLVNLDFKLREALEVELRALLREANTVVIYTSSDPRDAFNLGDQVVLLEQGRCLQSGPPLDVYRRPESLAAMELLSDPGVNRYQQGGTWFAVRPEHLVLDPATNLEHRFDLKVSAFETSGDETFLHGQLQDRGAVADWVVRCRGMVDVEVGQVVSLGAAAADVASFV